MASKKGGQKDRKGDFKKGDKLNSLQFFFLLLICNNTKELRMRKSYLKKKIKERLLSKKETLSCFAFIE
ncbi:CLUMA_CG018839, isoform A [Clunio marinus]|uniref:CLUMA_CG018839, isoform A n=1 Tax=Clunio marinus TaxID=568069 RepID=A0A1J1IZX1_9DIPT|nr:CLUMA_CG018839, isoform A [Clunio marinus]